MKILLSVIACTPYHGSENYGGWTAVKCLARDHNVWVITSKRNRPDLEKAETEGLVPQNVHFSYAGDFHEWHRIRLIARLQSWKEYVSFSKAILPVARDLHQAVKFDLVHHVNYATWRVASPLWKLGIPFIFGPIGGNERFPLRFFPMLSYSAAGFELFRMSSRRPGVSPPFRARFCGQSGNRKPGKSRARLFRGCVLAYLVLSFRRKDQGLYASGGC
jgi:hypothetical protein